MHTHPGTLMRLGDSDQMLADPAQDIRGYQVIDCDGKEIGRVDDLLADNEQQRVRVLRVEHGGRMATRPGPDPSAAVAAEQIPQRP